jgi:hypothetical protein
VGDLLVASTIDEVNFGALIQAATIRRLAVIGAALAMPAGFAP